MSCCTVGRVWASCKRMERSRLTTAFNSIHTPFHVVKHGRSSSLEREIYDQLSSSEDTFSIAWSDTRLGNEFHRYQPDIWYARIPVPVSTADLSLAIAASANNINLGALIEFDITAQAAGAAANDVYLNVPLEPGLAIMAVDAPRPCDVINGFVGCQLGLINAGEQKHVKITAAGAGHAGKRRLRVTATTSSKDRKANNNEVIAKVLVARGVSETATYSTGNIAIPIPSNSIIEVPVNVLDTGVLVGSEVSLRLDQEFAGELNVVLVAPTGETVELSTDRGGPGDNFGTGQNDCSGSLTVFDDFAKNTVIGGRPPFKGSYQPEQPFQELVGVGVTGLWKLRIKSFIFSKVGMVGCVNLTLNRVP